MKPVLSVLLAGSFCDAKGDTIIGVARSPTRRLPPQTRPSAPITQFCGVICRRGGVGPSAVAGWTKAFDRPQGDPDANIGTLPKRSSWSAPVIVGRLGTLVGTLSTRGQQ